jgi:hypothetical protein
LVEARILLRLGRLADARKVAEWAAAAAETPWEKRHTQALLKELASYEASREETKIPK